MGMAMAPTMQLDPVSSFCSRWGLSDQSRQFLLQLPQVGTQWWVSKRGGDEKIERRLEIELKSCKGILELHLNRGMSRYIIYCNYTYIYICNTYVYILAVYM